MATPLDVGVLSALKPAFVWLFVFAITYALLKSTKLLKDGSNSLSGLVAFVMATLFIMTTGLTETISLALPWFTLLVIVILFVTFIFMFAGVEDKFIAGVFKESGYAWFFIIIAVLIFGAALTQVYGPVVQGITSGEASQQGITYDVAKIAFNPKVLGIFLILVIASQTIRLVVK